MVKNICFVANFYLTPVFEAIARYVQQEGVKVYWIALKVSQYRHLVNTYGEENVLLIDRSYIRKDSPCVGDFKLNELIYGDRVWKYEKKEGALFLKNIQRPIYNFIKEHHISFVFGEVTWAHELLIHRMCTRHKELACSYYSMGVARIPNGRMCFFEDERQSKLVELAHKRKQILSDTSFQVEKPAYLSLNDKILKKNSSLLGKLNRIKRFLTNENIEKTDPNVNHGISRLLLPLREEVRRFSYRFLKRESPEILKERKYIFFGFHKQPEASIDVCGRYYENQSENVINIWRQLPPDWFLVIKEHSNAVGDRGYTFFRKLKKYPRVIVVHEKSDSYQLIRNSQLIITNTGTMALEAALMGIPAITLSPVFFNKLNYCRHFIWTDLEKYGSIADLVQEIKSSPDNKEMYQEYIMNNSVEGIFSDIKSMPTVLEEENLKKLVTAFLIIIG